MMKILITGGTGFIGHPLVEALLQKHYQVTVVSRQPQLNVVRRFSNPVNAVPTLAAIDADEKFDAVINLAGEGILNRRWSKQRKKVLLESRVNFTSELIDLLERMSSKPQLLVSGSAIGFYGAHSASEKIDELSPNGLGFAASLCQQWECAARRAESLGVRVCVVRIGMVLHPDGGALKKLLPAFRLGGGGVIAGGQQMMSWIHRDDLVALLLFLLNSNDIYPVYNAVAPTPVSNKKFTKMLANALHRPAILPLPAGVLRLALGEASTLLTQGQAVYPVRLVESGFSFKYPDIAAVFADFFH